MTNRELFALEYLHKFLGEYYELIIELEFNMSVEDFINIYIKEDEFGYYCDI